MSLWRVSEAGRPMDRYTVLQLWIICHGELSKQHQTQFLERPEVDDIAHFTKDEILVSMGRTKKLSEILAYLQVEQNSARRAPRTPRRQKKAPGGSSAPIAEPRVAATNRTGRRRAIGQVWAAPVEPEQAKRATPSFDKENREPYL